MHKIRVLFVCVGNTARSQMAEAFLQADGEGRFEVMSAGFAPGVLNPYAVRAMQDVGIDISGKKTKSVYALFKKQLTFDYVISVCDGAHAQKCPVFPGDHARLSWTYDDPALLGGSDAQIMEQVIRIRDAIRRDVRQFIEKSTSGHALFDESSRSDKKYVNTLLLQLLFNQIHTGVVIIDRTLQVLEINFAFSKMFGMTENVLVGHSLKILFDGLAFMEQLHHYEAHHEAVLETELLYRRRIYLVNGSRVDLGGGDLYMILTFTEITQSKKGALLEKQHDYLQRIIDAQPNFVAINDTKNLLFANRALLTFLGYKSLNAFRAHHACICEFFEPVEGYMRDFSEILAAERSKQPLVRMKSRIFQVGINTLEATSGRYIVTMTDVTERESLTARLEEEVEAAVAEKESQQALLFEQSKQVQTGQMISLIAHQWRQPLNTIATVVATLQRKSIRSDIDREELLKKLHTIGDIIVHMDHTINDFREFFKPDRDKRFIRLSILIEQAVGIAQISLEAKGILLELHTEVDEDVLVYPNEFKHVLLNLIKNAEEVLMEVVPDDPRIIVSSWREENGYFISVSDNGGGVDELLLPQLFTMYVTTKGSSGTGLGLYMSRVMIVEHMGGDIRAENSGDGAKFTIMLPKQG